MDEETTAAHAVHVQAEALTRKMKVRDLAMKGKHQTADQEEKDVRHGVSSGEMKQTMGNKKKRRWRPSDKR